MAASPGARAPRAVLRQTLRPLFVKADGVTPTSLKVVYDVVGWFVTMNTLNFICTSFALLSGDAAIQIYTDLYFIMHLAAIAVVALSFVVPAPKPKSKSVKQA